MNQAEEEFDSNTEYWPPLPSEIHCASCRRTRRQLNQWEDVCCLSDFAPGQTTWRVDLLYGCGTPRVPRPSHFFVRADTEEDVMSGLPDRVKRDHMWIVTVTRMDWPAALRFPLEPVAPQDGEIAWSSPIWVRY